MTNLSPNELKKAIAAETRNGKDEIETAIYIVQEDECNEGSFELTLEITLERWEDAERTILVGTFASEKAAAAKASRLGKQQDELSYEVEVSNC
jgi:hypothetical protein